jgi:hypothetical protein
MNAHLFTILDRVPAPTSAANDDEAIRDSNPADMRFLAYGAIAALLLCLGGIVLWWAIAASGTVATREWSRETASGRVSTIAREPR